MKYLVSAGAEPCPTPTWLSRVAGGNRPHAVRKIEATPAANPETRPGQLVSSTSQQAAQKNRQANAVAWVRAPPPPRRPRRCSSIFWSATRACPCGGAAASSSSTTATSTSCASRSWSKLNRGQRQLCKTRNLFTRNRVHELYSASRKRFPGSYCETFGLGGRIEANERANTRTVNGTGQGVF